MQPYVVMDCEDPERIAPFWCDLLDLQVTRIDEADGVYVLRSRSSGFLMGLQRVPEPKVGKNRMHLDVMVDALDTSTARVEALGGRWIEPDNAHETHDGFAWRVMADPEGNEFCIVELPPAAPASN